MAQAPAKLEAAVLEPDTEEADVEPSHWPWRLVDTPPEPARPVEPVEREPKRSVELWAFPQLVDESGPMCRRLVGFSVGQASLLQEVSHVRGFLDVIHVLGNRPADDVRARETCENWQVRFHCKMPLDDSLCFTGS